jgi:hypothetical protein
VHLVTICQHIFLYLLLVPKNCKIGGVFTFFENSRSTKTL